MKIILISGKAQNGKDTTADFLRSALEADGCKVLVAHYGDLLKYICKTFFDWDGEKDERGRTILECVKATGFDTVHLRVVRSNFESPLTPEQQVHPSETALDNTINSGALKDLQNAVVAWLTDFNGQHQMTFEEML